MIWQNWVKCSEDIKQVSGVCSSWLRGRDPKKSQEKFKALWCHNSTLASVSTVTDGAEQKLSLTVHLSATTPVSLF